MVSSFFFGKFLYLESGFPQSLHNAGNEASAHFLGWADFGFTKLFPTKLIPTNHEICFPYGKQIWSTFQRDGQAKRHLDTTHPKFKSLKYHLSISFGSNILQLDVWMIKNLTTYNPWNVGWFKTRSATSGLRQSPYNWAVEVGKIITARPKVSLFKPQGFTVFNVVK